MNKLEELRDCQTCENAVAIGGGASVCTESGKVCIEDYWDLVDGYKQDCENWEER